MKADVIDMLPGLVFDTHAWIEVFKGTPKGRQCVELMSKHPVATALASLSEIQSWAKRHGKDPQPFIERVEKYSAILPFTKTVALLAGDVHVQFKEKVRGAGMVDAMIYANARAYGLTVVSGDTHFKDLPDAMFLG